MMKVVLSGPISLPLIDHTIAECYVHPSTHLRATANHLPNVLTPGPNLNLIDRHGQADGPYMRLHVSLGTMLQ